ncbi:MAG: WS/DGAT/MGAT family O-acyltransferase [Acidimicrobiales bacterium]
MEQLTGLDAGFLALESGSAVGHVSGLLICDPSTSPEPWTFPRYREHLLSRLHLLPVYTKKLKRVPFGIDQPYWVPDDDFDLDYHLRRVAVPGDGGREAFAAFVARVHERPLDRSRPLWECYVIEGVDGDKIGLLSKIHHAAIDGQAGVEMLAAVVDLTPDSPPRPDDGPSVELRAPSPQAMAMRAATNLLLSPWEVAKTGTMVAKALPSLGSALSRPQMLYGGKQRTVLDDLRRASTAPATSFNTVIGPHRRFAYSTVPLAAVKAVKNAAGATINDVVMAMVGDMLRGWLLAHDELPEQSLIAMVPVSLRKEGETEAGNKVTSVLAPLATHLHDPLDRLGAVRAGMQAAKEQHRGLPPTMLPDLIGLAPPYLAEFAAKVASEAKLAKWVNNPFNVVVSNVPGPPFPLYLNGAKLEHNIPLSAITDGVGLNVTLQSTDSTMDIGLVADRDLVPDLWDIADSAPAALQSLADALGVDLAPFYAPDAPEDAGEGEVEVEDGAEVIDLDAGKAAKAAANEAAPTKKAKKTSSKKKASKNTSSK